MFELLIFVNLTMGGRPDPNCCDVKFVKVSHLSERLCIGCTDGYSFAVKETIAEVEKRLAALANKQT